jgi:hypothetical protein
MTPGALTMDNMVDGGAYTLVARNTNASAGTFTFNGTGPLVFRFKPSNAVTAPGATSVYTFIRVGLNVYTGWMTGF